ncbi:PREDICTED: tumor necrosis factor alpha-induced protein 8-like protein [Nicrophorus vespilloides]|uniref:Tumor necrosis factor alpha-induced protein 8-like protein n=1 Tax=Nicrophorus vespilloides TaxID=110193 RepID=A0ABM1MJA9_NICVS|nr:PREDICTED: tumor necrosis factor alpha-induced protein 8-like protein [Nicrophorus vespilloides]
MTTIVELESWVIYQCIVTECSDCLFMSESAFRARDIGLRAQKKILSRMANKNFAKAFIDDNTSTLLDNLYRLVKQYSNNKKEAEKLIKNIIKVVIKIAVIGKNEQFSNDEVMLAEDFKKKFHKVGMAIVSFYEVDYSYDQKFLVSVLNDSHTCLNAIVSKHLTDKSISRIDSVFNFFTNEQFLDTIFKPDSEYRDILGRLVTDLNRAMEKGDL